MRSRRKNWQGLGRGANQTVRLHGWNQKNRDFIAELGKVDINGVEIRPIHEWLSEREMATLLLLAKGLRTDEVKDELIVSMATVRTYIARIHRKLGTDCIQAAVKYAFDHGLIMPAWAEEDTG